MKKMNERKMENEFAVNHYKEGYTVESVKYVKDADGNWTTVSIDYKRIIDDDDDKFESLMEKCNKLIARYK